MADEWGPWIEHDGKGCPCVGEWVEAAFRLWYKTEQFIAGSDGGGSWAYGDSYDMRTWHGDPVIRYRIRKPKGLTMLEGILREVEDDGGVGYKDREREDV